MDAAILPWLRELNHSPTTSPRLQKKKKTDIFRSQLIPANRPGLALARWRTDSRTDELHLQIFQEALVEPGLLEAIVLSIILLQSGHSFGDTIEPIAFMGAVGAGPPLFF